MFSGSFEARNSALRRAHATGDHFLREPRPGAGRQHFTRQRVLNLKGTIGIAKPTAFQCLFEESLVVVPHRVVFDLSHFVPLSCVYGQF